MTFEEFKKRATNGTLIKNNIQSTLATNLPEANRPVLNSKTQTPKENVIGKVIATPVAAFGQLGTGVLQGLEGAMDFGASAGATAISSMRGQSIEGMKKDLQKLQKQGNSEAAAKLQKIINETQSTKDYADDLAKNFIAKQWTQDSVGKVNDEFTEKYSYLPVKAGQIVKTVGNMLPSIANAGSIAKSLPQATTKIGQLATKGATMLPFMAQAAGSSTEQALNEGASLQDATKYGLASGAIEGAIESISGGIGGAIGGKVLSSKLGREAVERITQNALGKFALKLADAGIDVFGEGFEEVLSTAINPLIQRMTYDEKAELATSEEMMQSFIDGALASLLVKGGQAGISRLTNQNNADLQENEALNQAQSRETNPTNAITSNQAEMAQNANMNQIRDNTKLITQRDEQTLQSAKLAGMTDMDIQKAKELNDMLRSGARLNFYDEKTIPQNVQADKAKIANGFYKDGTLWINKNSKNKVEQILGHELTHHLETTNSYNDLSNTILDSEVFYDFIAEKGYTNVAEYKTKLKEMGYTDAQMNNEMVARFVEEKMFTDQASIDRLARQNTNLVEKIKNWISDLVVSFKGTAQEKELRRIENMYRKALDQARNSTATAETQYSVGGVIGARNIQNNPEYRNIMTDYREANVMLKNGMKNSETIRKTGWFKDTDGNIKYEFSDEDMALKESYKFETNKIYPLDNILKHDILFEAYPQLRDYTVVSMNLGDKHRAAIFGPMKVILLNNQLLKTKGQVEYSLIHEIQHAIQNIEGFPGARTNINGKYAYYTSLGEIESRDTSDRLRMLAEERRMNIPETAKENPTHPGLENYLKNRKEADIEKDNKYIAKKERTDALKESVKKFIEGRMGFDDFEESDNSNIYKTTSEDDKLSSRTDGRGRLAGKEPAFSMPETDNQGRTLSKEQQEFFKDSKVRDEEGRLKAVYHGTAEEFTIFDEMFAKEGDYGVGFYFSDVKGVAEESAEGKMIDKDIARYASGDKGQVMETYLDMKKPSVWYNYRDIYKYNKMAKEAGLNLYDYMRKNYDGIIVTNPRYENEGFSESKYYVVFNPNQIKNVDNTNPTENPDIRYSMNPVEVAKKPPNIETGLDQLKRTSRVKEGDTQSNFTRNIYNQNIFDEKFKDLALDDKNIQSYERISNKETLQQANDAINEQGQKWVDRFLDKPNGELKATDIAGGFILMNRYQQVGDYESMIRVAEKLRKAGTQQGQTIQMFSVLGRMTPEGMTYYAQKELNKAYDEILKNKTQKWADEHADEFRLNDRDIEYIQRRVNQAARLPEGRDKYVLLGEIASRIQNKIPPQAGQGLKALARNSMLLNPKTMVRNILGNVVIVPNHIVSDFVGAGIDKAISKKTGVRTTGGFDVKALQGAKKGIYESFDDFRRKISTREMGGDRFEIGQGKNFYENHTGRFGETRNKINKALNGLDRVTGFLLETGDRPFYETWFMNSLNNQMKLNNVTEPTAEMIEIATDEALQRTWQDSNSYTEFVTNFRKGLNKVNVKGYGLGDIVMPFVKTPANLTKAVVDFSPLGAINAAVKTSQFNRDIGKGVATTKQQREVVKAWSQVITGTIGMAIMTVMANAGILGGGSDEDKDVRNFEQKILGIKPYSIKIGDKSYTYDWAQPLGTSAAMVADTVKSLKNAKDTEGKVAAALDGLQSGASVLLEQSFVSGIRQFFEEDGLISAIIEAIFNEPTKFTPQFLSQLAQLQDDTERVSFVYNNIPQTAKNKIKAKIPGVRETLEPNVDVLGREVKTDNSIGNVMFNPANTAMASTTKAAEEMYRVYKATGEKSAIAQVAPYYFDVGSEKIILTPKQKTQYQKTIGKIASDGVENLIDNKAYKNLPDTDKAKILEELYSYGNAVAKEEASKKYLMPKDMKKIKDSGMKPEEYILAKHISSIDGVKKDEMYDSMTSAGYSDKKTKEFLTYYKGYKFEDTASKNLLPTLASQRAKLPTLKK